MKLNIKCIFSVEDEEEEEERWLVHRLRLIKMTGPHRSPHLRGGEYERVGRKNMRGGAVLHFPLLQVTTRVLRLHYS